MLASLYDLCVLCSKDETSVVMVGLAFCADSSCVSIASRWSAAFWWASEETKYPTLSALQLSEVIHRRISQVWWQAVSWICNGKSVRRCKSYACLLICAWQWRMKIQSITWWVQGSHALPLLPSVLALVSERSGQGFIDVVAARAEGLPSRLSRYCNYVTILGTSQHPPTPRKSKQLKSN